MEVAEIRVARPERVWYDARWVIGLRVFFCFSLNSTVRSAITAISDGLVESLGERTRATWVRPANYHVTVRFLGEVDNTAPAALERAARDVARRSAPFNLSFDRIGCFPSIDRPRVLWVGGGAPTEYRDICSTLECHLSSLGIPRGRLDDLAHITLARFRDARPADVVQAIERAGSPRLSQLVDRLILMESRLTPHGAVYRPLFDVQLGPEEENHAV